MYMYLLSIVLSVVMLQFTLFCLDEEGTATQLYRVGVGTFYCKSSSYLYEPISVTCPNILGWCFSPLSFAPDCDISFFSPIFTLAWRTPVTDYFWGILVKSKLFLLWIYMLSQVPLILLFASKVLSLISFHFL